MSFTMQWTIITDVSLISKYMIKLKIFRENLSECLFCLPFCHPFPKSKYPQEDTFISSR